MMAMKLTGVKLGILSGVGVASLAGWGLGGVLPGLQAGIVWTLGTIFGVLTVLLVSGRQASRLGMAVLAGSGVRMLSALTMGLFSYLAFKPEGRTFWACFLLAGLCCLICETVWAVRTLRDAQTENAISTGVS